MLKIKTNSNKEKKGHQLATHEQTSGHFFLVFYFLSFFCSFLFFPLFSFLSLERVTWKGFEKLH